jgi:hypothetical protein
MVTRYLAIEDAELANNLGVSVSQKRIAKPADPIGERLQNGCAVVADRRDTQPEFSILLQ